MEWSFEFLQSKSSNGRLFHGHFLVANHTVLSFCAKHGLKEPLLWHGKNKEHFLRFRLLQLCADNSLLDTLKTEPCYRFL